MEFTRRIYENGKVTIPKELRDLFGIREGDFIRLEIREVIAKPGAAGNGAPAMGGTIDVQVAGEPGPDGGDGR